MTTPPPNSTPPAGFPRENPPHDMRITGTPMLPAPLFRGSIAPAPWASFNGPQKVDLDTTLTFLYNPSNVKFSHRLDANNSMIPTPFRSDADPTQYIGFSNSSLSMTLLFDRTYDMTDPARADQPAARYGCFVDISTLYAICGIHDTHKPEIAATAAPTTTPAVPGTPAAPGAPATGSPQSTGSYTGIMAYRPVYVVFGDWFSLTAVSTYYDYVRWYGIISSIGIDISHWSTKMLPMRAAVSIEISLLVKYGA